MFDTAYQFFVLQQHQMHVEQRCQFMRRFFRAHMHNAGLQAMNLIHHRIAPAANPVNFGAYL